MSQDTQELPLASLRVPSMMTQILPRWADTVYFIIRDFASVYELTKNQAGQPVDYANRARLSRFAQEKVYRDEEIFCCLAPILADDWALQAQSRNITPKTIMSSARRELKQELICKWNDRIYNILKTLDTIGPNTEHAGQPINWDDPDQLFGYVTRQNKLPSDGVQNEAWRNMTKMLIAEWVTKLATNPAQRLRHKLGQRLYVTPDGLAPYSPLS